MMLTKVLGTAGLLAFSGNFLSALTLDDVTTVILTSTKSPNTSSTFTTISRTYSEYGCPTAQVAELTTLEGMGDAAQGNGVSNEPGQVMQEEPHESLITSRAYGTLTITLTEVSTTKDVTYTGSIDFESMVTLNAGTHTTTEGIVATVTDTPQGSDATTAVAYSSAATGAISAPSGGSFSVTTQPGLPSVTPTTIASGTGGSSSSISIVQTTTIAGSSTKTVTHSHTDADIATSSTTAESSSAATESAPSATDSSAGVAPISVKKTMGILAGLAGIVMVAL